MKLQALNQPQRTEFVLFDRFVHALLCFVRMMIVNLSNYRKGSPQQYVECRDVKYVQILLKKPGKNDIKTQKPIPVSVLYVRKQCVSLVQLVCALTLFRKEKGICVCVTFGVTRFLLDCLIGLFQAGACGHHANACQRSYA